MTGACGSTSSGCRSCTEQEEMAPMIGRRQFLEGTGSRCPNLTICCPSARTGCRWRWLLVLGLLALVPKITGKYKNYFQTPQKEKKISRERTRLCLVCGVRKGRGVGWVCGESGDEGSGRGGVKSRKVNLKKMVIFLKPCSGEGPRLPPRPPIRA